VLALFAFSSGPAFAQITGKVIGTVTDGETGQPLVGAQVVVEGTNLGNVTNEDGYYFINNIPVGVQAVTAQYLGYQTTTNEQRVLAGQTMTVDFRLSSEIVEAEGIIAVIEREPLVARDNTISKSRFTGEEVRSLPVDDIDEVITLGAGVYRDGIGGFRNVTGTPFGAGLGGFVIRGGRSSESTTLVDGVQITDFSTQNNLTEIGGFGIEEIDVVTGGFNAEFGNAQSGVVNIVTRAGGREFHGNARFTTDELELEQSYGYNNIEGSIGGPIVPDVLTFFGSASITGAEDFFPSVAGFNPLDGFTTDGTTVRAITEGSTETLLPGNRGDQTRAQGKITAFLPSRAKLTTTYLYSRDQFERYDHNLQSEQFRDNSSDRQKTHDIIVGYDQQVFQTAERNLNIQVRGNWHSTKRFVGLAKTPETAAVVEQGIGDACGSECSFSGDTWDDDFLNWRWGDIEFMFEDSAPGSTFNLPLDRTDPPDTVFGIPRLATLDGLNSRAFLNRQERRYGVRVDVDTQLNRIHRAKIGFEHTWINYSQLFGSLTSSTFADKYDVDPRVLGVYFQDRLDYGDLVIDLGVRYDRWDPNTVFPAVTALVPCDIAAFANQCTEGAESRDAPTREEWAPRLGVAHPITDNTQVRLSYGKFYQLPELRHYFGAYTTNFPGNPNIDYGNPDLDFVETTAFEAGITHLISENLVLDVVGYNRDRRGAVRQQVFQPDEIQVGLSERRIFVNGDNGNVKGMDLTLSKRFSNYFSSDVAWSLQWARGTTSSPLDWVDVGGFGRLTDPLNVPALFTPPTQLQPEDFDRLHNLNYQFVLRFPNDFKEGTTPGAIFKDFGVSLVYNAQSGTPYTRRQADARGAPVEELGSSRMPWIHSGDVRVTKGFPIAAGLDVSVFMLVQNFLNIENEFFVHSTTGRSDANGFEDDDIPSVPEFHVDGANATFPYEIEDIVEFDDEFPGVPIRERIRNQDLNGDGTVTFEEAEAILLEARRVSEQPSGPNAVILGDDPLNYGPPRTWRFGAEFRF
jgi:outer membrane receptor protein involved in Fe transport